MKRIGRTIRARFRREISMTPLKEVKSSVTTETKIVKEVKEDITEEENVSYSKELTSKYEKENPGKHAIWRGNYTKGFKQWAADASPS
jgi:hypothetical protein